VRQAEVNPPARGTRSAITRELDAGSGARDARALAHNEIARRAPRGMHPVCTTAPRRALASRVARSAIDTTKGVQHMLETAQATPRQEGRVAKAIEKQTSKMPSDWFLWAAVGAIATSFVLQSTHHKERSLFIGQWVPTLLVLGLYNKIVKVAGSDSTERQGSYPS
jgi:hypothetical protein